MSRLVRLLALLLGFALFEAVAESNPNKGCAGGVVARVHVALEKISHEILNEVSGSIGFFYLTNSSDAVIRLSGWIRQDVMWLEYPVATLQVKDGNWRDVTPMLGSFMTDGVDKKIVGSGESLRIAARVDFGVPPEAQIARLVINLPTKACVVSSPFRLPSRKN